MAKNSQVSIVPAIIFGIVILWIFKACNTDSATPTSIKTDTPKERELKLQMADLIKTKNLWCDKVEDITPSPWNTSPNKREYRVFCSNGVKAVNYTVTIYDAYYTVTE